MASPSTALASTPTERELLARLTFECWKERGRPDNSEVSRVELISLLAYALWETHGRTEGSADRDWFEAEEYVRELIASEAAVSG
jgi:Protein of unknown function (DUF2934)